MFNKISSPIVWIFISYSILFMLMGYYLWDDYHKTIDKFSSSLQNITMLSSFKLESDFKQIEEIFHYMNDIILNSGFTDNQINERLIYLKENFSLLDSINFIDDNLQLKYSSVIFTPFRIIDFSDRDFFVTLKENYDTIPFMFTEIIESRTLNTQAIAFLKPVIDDNGKFIGVFSAAIKISNLSEILGLIRISSYCCITLIKSDTGTIIAKISSTKNNEQHEQRIQTLDNPVFRQISETGSTSGLVKYRFNDINVMTFYRVMEKYPFYIQASYPQYIYLSDWYIKLTIFSVIVMFLIIGIFIIIFTSSKYNIFKTKYQKDIEFAKKEAAAATTAKTKFLAVLSHEIRTPMTGIIGMAELLLDESLNSQKVAEYASIILSSSNVLLKLINDILDLSKIEAGKFVISEEKMCPSSIVADVKSLFSFQAEAKGIVINSRVETNKCYLGDDNRIRQMLFNLVSNAVKFTDSGFIDISVKEVIIENSNDEVMLEFTVKDTGIGIPEKESHLLFIPFEQLHNFHNNSIKGTGLGLSIVKNLALLMGGTVGFESTENKGSLFWFTIKVKSNVDVESLCSIYNKNREKIDKDKTIEEQLLKENSKFNILIAEDNITNQMVVRNQLEKLGYIKYIITENGEDAVRAVKNFNGRIDLILMDIEMPIMNGLDATLAIRKLGFNEPIIALSANAFPDDMKRALNCGMNDFLPKPSEINALKHMLHNWLHTIRL